MVLSIGSTLTLHLVDAEREHVLKAALERLGVLAADGEELAPKH